MRWQGEQFTGGTTTAETIQRYLRIWQSRDYETGIPDEVPHELAKENLAPSWKAIAVALLNNDLQLLSLGFTGKVSAWYSQIKRSELQAKCKQEQLTLF